MYRLFAAGKVIGRMSRVQCEIWLTEHYKLSAVKLAELFADGEVYKGAVYFQVKAS